MSKVNKLLLFFLMFMPFLAYSKYNLCIVAIFQDEADYLDEWIQYHYDHGIDHFYLYNNNSTDEFQDVLCYWVENQIVDVIEWGSKDKDGPDFFFKTQVGAYNHAIENFKHTSKWIAFIDTDEFIACPLCKDIGLYLTEYYKHYSGVCINWQCYGTSNVYQCPKGEILKYLIMKMKWDHDWNKHSKVIVQPTHVKTFVNPHFCTYKPGFSAVDTHYFKCDACPNRVFIDRLRLNHYWTRDEWYFRNRKIARHSKWGSNIEGLIEHAGKMNEEYDPILSNPGG